MTVPITSDLGGYVAFWLPVVIGCGLWAAAMLVVVLGIFFRLGGLARWK